VGAGVTGGPGVGAYPGTVVLAFVGGRGKPDGSDPYEARVRTE
jgi:hypothetical protein